SVVLFVLYAEPLVCVIRGSQVVKGITLPRGESLKISQYKLNIIYTGQPLVCRRCGSKGHEAAHCNQVRYFLIYVGQPLCCRKCGGKGHDAEHCDQVRCRSCNSMGHSTRDCTEPKRCHLCESEEHMARDCTKPRPYGGQYLPLLLIIKQFG
uniref:CCHC-type domain-containing protein n=1 Tax=Oreochromis aureus TaxID=47969 RepID=A0A668SWD7_OREAU